MIEPDYQLAPRMNAKLAAIPFPDFQGKTVLDVGCDMGYWCRYALDHDAAGVLGIDRGREVKGQGFVDLVKYCTDTIPDKRAGFYKMEVGKQWHELGQFDVIFLFSLYHHIYQAAGGDHAPIWFWLSRHLKTGGVLLWENPTGLDDSVVQHNVSAEYHANYNLSAILCTASRYFDIEHIGPAKHEPTRSVYRFTRRIDPSEVTNGKAQDGAGGATKAFNYADGRRIKEIENILGVRCYPGSLNLKMQQRFDWERGYYRAQCLDVKNRGQGLTSPWVPRWARFYPVILYGGSAYAFRFEGEQYSDDFVELIAERRLRDNLPGEVRLYR